MSVRAPSERIETERLVLLANAMGEAFGVSAGKSRSAVCFQAIDLDRARLREFLPWVDFTKTEGDSDAYFSQCEENRTNFQGFDYGVFLRSGEYVGNIGLHTVSKSNARAEIGYWIAGEFEGRGFISEAVRGLVKDCFTSGFHRLEIRCNAENGRSYAVPECVGFRFEGELREDCLEYTDWRNTRIYGLIVSDSIS